MLAVMSAWFPNLGHPIPKDVAILCRALLLAEQPLFFLSWHFQTIDVMLSALLAHGWAGFVRDHGGAMHTPRGEGARA